MTQNTPQDYARFCNIGYEDFRAMAQDQRLSCYEKVGFPDSYRSGKEGDIFDDLCVKLPALNESGKTILDIGCGCSDLPRLLATRADEKRQNLTLMDSAEMLAQLPENVRGAKMAAKFPECPDFLRQHAGNIDVIIAYSVIQYVFAEGNIFDFLDQALGLLASGGRFLIGDIPNISMRKRFFASATGMAHHRAFTGKDEDPVVTFNTLDKNIMDDTVVMALAARARIQGFHAFIVPQPDCLPMANRREDILIIRP